MDRDLLCAPRTLALTYHGYCLTESRKLIIPLYFSTAALQEIDPFRNLYKNFGNNLELDRIFGKRFFAQNKELNCSESALSEIVEDTPILITEDTVLGVKIRKYEKFECKRSKKRAMIF